jgi:hypothetical protein
LVQFDAFIVVDQRHTALRGRDDERAYALAHGFTSCGFARAFDTVPFSTHW